MAGMNRQEILAWQGDGAWGLTKHIYIGVRPNHWETGRDEQEQVPMEAR